MKIPTGPENVSPPQMGEEFIFFNVRLTNTVSNLNLDAAFSLRIDIRTGEMKDIYLLGVKPAVGEYDEQGMNPMGVGSNPLLNIGAGSMGKFVPHVPKKELPKAEPFDYFDSVK